MWGLTEGCHWALVCTCWSTAAKPVCCYLQDLAFVLTQSDTSFKADNRDMVWDTSGATTGTDSSQSHERQSTESPQLSADSDVLFAACSIDCCCTAPAACNLALRECCLHCLKAGAAWLCLQSSATGVGLAFLSRERI